MRKMLLMMLLAICTLSISAQSASNKDATIVSDSSIRVIKTLMSMSVVNLTSIIAKGRKIVLWSFGIMVVALPAEVSNCLPN